jgi:hypothetical protein
LCARSLASFVNYANFDGVDISFRDNVAFNLGIAENWIIKFNHLLRSLLPFHIITHSPNNFHMSFSRYPGGGYPKINANLNSEIDFYNIIYYGQSLTKFDNYN